MKKNRYLWWGVAIIGAVLVGAWYILPALLSGQGFTSPATGSGAPRPPPPPPPPPGPVDPYPPEPIDPYSVGSYWSGYWDDPERGPVDAALAWLTDTTYYTEDD